MPTLTPTRGLDGRVNDITEQVAAKRREAAEAWQRFEQRREVLARDDSATALSAAEEAQRAYDALATELHELETRRDGLWRMLPGNRAARTAMHNADITEPGAWLAHVLERHALGVQEIGTISTSEAFLDRLSQASALMAAGPSVLDIDTSEVRISRMTGKLDPAPPIPELAEIGESAVPLEPVTVTPPKYARLAVASVESYADARPATLAAVERELVRSVATGFDLAALHGAAASVQVGLENTAGIATVDAAGALTDLSPFVRALGALRASGTVGSAFIMHPNLWTRLGLIPKQDGSAEPLVAAQLSATGRPAESILGTAVYLSEVCEEDKAFALDAEQLIVVRRSEVETDVDPYYSFSKGGVGVRVIVRASLLPAQPAAVAMVENLPTA
jgi:hypothetical protein